MSTIQIIVRLAGQRDASRNSGSQGVVPVMVPLGCVLGPTRRRGACVRRSAGDARVYRKSTSNSRNDKGLIILHKRIESCYVPSHNSLAAVQFAQHGGSYDPRIPWTSL